MAGRNGRLQCVGSHGQGLGLAQALGVLQRGQVIAAGDYDSVSNDANVREAYMGVEHA